MSDKDKAQNPEQQEPEKETGAKEIEQPQEKQREESKKESSKAAKSNNNSKEEVVPKQHYDSVKGELSQKAKEYNELQKQVALLKNRDEVRELLLDSDYPDSIKKKLKAKLDRLTPDTFESEAQELLDVYNDGLEAKKQKQSELKRPDKKEIDNGLERIKETENIKSLEEELLAQGIAVTR